jgi:hypothetical protein
MPIPSTVFDRAQKNGGFMMSSSNPMGRALEEMQPESEAPVEEGGGSPPNLRDALNEAPICGSCIHFAGTECSKFGNYPVKFHEGCDAHESTEGPEEPASDDEPLPVEPVADEEMA